VKFAFLSSYAHLVLDEKSTRTSGGAELQLALLARELAALGHEAVVLGGDTGQPDGAIWQGVKVRNAGRFHTGKMGEMLGALPRVFGLLREEKPDWLFLLGWTAWLAPLRAGCGWWGGRVGFICGLDTEVNGEFRRAHPVRGALFEWGVRQAHARYAMTRQQEILFHERGLACGFYRNLILPRAFSPAGEKTVDFLWVSRCQKIKRPWLFLDLARAVPGARFRMICPGEDPELFQRISAEAAALSNVEFIPSVPYHQIQAHYDAARVFVNTSEWEGWANSFIQAGQGAAALLSLRVQPDTLFDDYALGFCAGGSWEEFVKAARAMWQDEEATAAMGRECARFVEELHDNRRETAAFLRDLPKKL
jgi:glycosyltransferase involved in cell wall biosynthesis